MSLKSIIYSSLFAATAIAQYGGGGGGSYGGGSPPSGPPAGEMGGSSSGNGWSSWSNQGPPAMAAASCPAGCQPMGPPPPMQTQPGQLIVQVVSVSDANGSLKYFPDKVTAPVGSIVQFQYHPKVCQNDQYRESKALTAFSEPYSHRINIRGTLQSSPRQHEHPDPPRSEIRLRPSYRPRTLHPSLQRPHQRHQAHLDLLRSNQPLPKGHGHGHQPERYLRQDDRAVHRQRCYDSSRQRCCSASCCWYSATATATSTTSSG
jgi:hypothetical protein